MIRATCLALVFALVASAVSAQPYIATDGDSLRAGDERIRIGGADAPELSQVCELNGAPWLCGRVAWRALIALNPVRCEASGTDRFKRTLARCFDSAGRDIGAELVRQGMAVAFTRYSLDYVSQENEARAAGRGLWAPGVRFVRPEDHRRGERLQMGSEQ